jgi:hypothetical protein
MENNFPNVHKILEKIGEWVIKEYRNKLDTHKPHPKRASGKLYANVDYRVEVESDDNVRLFFVAPDEYYNKEKKEWYIEAGRKPGSKPPPIAVVRKWISMRGIQPKEGMTKEGLPYAIQRGIAKNGIKRYPILPKIKQDLKEWEDEIKDAFKKDIELMLKTNLKTTIIKTTIKL